MARIFLACTTIECLRLTLTMLLNCTEVRYKKISRMLNPVKDVERDARGKFERNTNITWGRTEENHKPSYSGREPGRFSNLKSTYRTEVLPLWWSAAKTNYGPTPLHKKMFCLEPALRELRFIHFYASSLKEVHGNPVKFTRLKSLLKSI